MEAKFNEAMIVGHKKVAGEHSLTVGEIVFTILGVLIFLYGSKAKIPAGLKVWVALAVIFMGEWLF